jgi:hypothetical protein
MWKTKAVITVAGVAGTLVASQRARDVSGAVLRWSHQKGYPAARQAVALLRGSEDDSGTNAGTSVADLAKGFAGALDRGLAIPEEWFVRIPATPAAAGIAPDVPRWVEAELRGDTMVATRRPEAEHEETAPFCWSDHVAMVEEGLDDQRPVKPIFVEPSFREPTFRDVADVEQRGRWADVTGPISPALGTEAVPVVITEASVGSIPEPWPPHVRLPRLSSKRAPWEEAGLRRPRRHERMMDWVRRDARAEHAMGELHRKWADDTEGRAAVHIANDPVELHDELSRRGVIGEKVFSWRPQERTTGGTIRGWFGRIWPGGNRGTSSTDT